MPTQTKTNLKPQTVKRLLAILDYLKEEPKRLDMGLWGIKFNPKDKFLVKELADSIAESVQTVQEMPPCGTAACLAGTALVLFAPKSRFKTLLEEDHVLEYVTDKKTGLDKDVEHAYCSFDEHTPEEAQTLLGLTQPQANVLFYPTNWPYEANNAYNDASDLKTPKARATARYKATADYVNRFLKFDGDIRKMFASYDEDVPDNILLELEEDEAQDYDE